MIRIHPRLFAGVLGLACGTVAHSAPAIIDSEQKAQAALATALAMPQQPVQELRLATDFARGKVEDALAQLAAATTPAALAHSKDGIHLPCAASGELAATLSRNIPRTLKLRWNACRFVDRDGRTRGREGQIDVLLFSDSFTPERVASIRLGTPTADFVETRHIDEDGQITDEARSSNLRIAGVIPMTRAFPLYGYFTGQFAFEQTGFYREEISSQYPIGAPVTVSTSTASYDHVTASGSLTYNDAKTYLTESLQLYWGNISHDSTATGWPDSTSGYVVDNLRLRAETDFVKWTQKQWVDGRIDYQWPSTWPAACLSGPYSFRTVAPLSGPAFSGAFESGDLLINGALRAQFYSAANVPAGLPAPQQGMLLRLRAPAAGTFLYDVPDTYAVTIRSGCY